MSDDKRILGPDGVPVLPEPGEQVAPEEKAEGEVAPEAQRKYRKVDDFELLTQMRAMKALFVGFPHAVTVLDLCEANLTSSVPGSRDRAFIMSMMISLKVWASKSVQTHVSFCRNLEELAMHVLQEEVQREAAIAAQKRLDQKLQDEFRRGLKGVKPS